MQHILYEMFLNDCIEKLDEKYKSIIKPQLDKTFLYANIIEFTFYYKPFSKDEKKDYGLYKKLHNNKQIETIELLKKEILENNYDIEALLFLYGYISHLIFDYYFNSYIKNFLNKNKISDIKNNYLRFAYNIESLYYKERTSKKLKKIKVNPKSYELTTKTQELINKILKEIHLSSMGINIYLIGMKNFKKSNSNIFYRLKYNRYKKNKYSPSLIYRVKRINKKIDYLNKEKEAWYLYDLTQTKDSFIELYDKAVSKSIEIIDTLNNEIFYRKNPKKSSAEQLKNLLGI